MDCRHRRGAARTFFGSPRILPIFAVGGRPSGRSESGFLLPLPSAQRRRERVPPPAGLLLDSARVCAALSDGRLPHDRDAAERVVHLRVDPGALRRFLGAPRAAVDGRARDGGGDGGTGAARRASRTIAVFTGALALTWPLAILQMGSSQTDLLVAAAERMRGLLRCCVDVLSLATGEPRGSRVLRSRGSDWPWERSLRSRFLLPALAVALTVLAVLQKKLELVAAHRRSRPRSALRHSARTTTP